ncbi:hypothetical protein ECG_03709 [Echinococcus granulosus]|nr:hypothetical protein ECG_03709 [Echinococcus granulosus]
MVTCLNLTVLQTSPLITFESSRRDAGGFTHTDHLKLKMYGSSSTSITTVSKAQLPYCSNLHEINILAPKAETAPKPNKKGKTRKRASPKLSGTTKPPPDILDPPAMENLDFIAHNAPEALAYRNYRWQGNKKKKG